MQSGERREEDVDAITKPNQVIRYEESDSTKGDAGEELEATTEQPRGQG
jgi:hypothetical protein